MACPLCYTKDGFENQIGTNHIGHFELTVGLMPALINAYKVTGKYSSVANVSSLAHRFASVDLNDINFKNKEYEEFASYGQSKTTNILFSVELTRRFQDKGVISNALHPGVIKTNLQRHTPPEKMKKLGWMDEKENFIHWEEKSIGEGASTSVYVAVASNFSNVGGLYFEDCNLATTEKYAVDQESSNGLWDLTEKLIQDAKKKKKFKLFC